MKLAVLTPLPPVRSGIAHYSSLLLPELAKHHQVSAVVAQAEFESPSGCNVVRYQDFDRGRFDRVICQLGNNPHHEFVYREAISRPSVVVLHDYVLHHLIVETTLARGHGDDYVEQLGVSHGALGTSLAQGRVAGFHGEIGNFLYPASAAVAQRSEAVIVHNRYAAESLRRLGVKTPIILVGHPYRPPAKSFDRERVRRELGYQADQIVIGLFGFLTAAKRPEIVFEAFAKAFSQNDRMRLLIVGEPAPNIDLQSLASSLPKHAWRALGYVADEQFDEYLAGVDKVVNLRYPTAGETSGALIRVFVAGKPVAVSDYAQFAEYPDEIAAKIPFGPAEVDTLREFLLRRDDEGRIARDQAEWLRKNATVQGAVQGYLRAVAGENDVTETAAAAQPKLPVLARLELRALDVTRQDHHWRVHCVLANIGPTRLEAGVFGEPGYRVLAKVFLEDQEIFDRWIPLPRDLAPGASAAVEFEFSSLDQPHRLELSHAIEGVTHFEFQPFASAELRA